MTPCRGSDRRVGDDRGAALVEFGLILPLILVLVLGVMEFGMLYRTSNQLEHSLMIAGRVAGQQSNGRFADYEALRSLDSSLRAATGSTITKVIIYKAVATDGKPPPACLAVVPTGSKAGVAGVCNVYSSAQVGSSSLAAFPLVCGSSWDGNWCPTVRDPQSDRVGVYVELKYQPLTGIIPKSFSATASAVYDVEPTPIES